MSQEMNQLPIRHTATSATVSTVAGTAGGAAKGALKWGLLTALGVSALVGVGTALLVSSIPAIATGAVAMGAVVGIGTAFWTVIPSFTAGAWLGGITGAYKGGKAADARVQQQSANANVLDAQLQAAAMDAQARVYQAQAQGYAPPRVHHAVPETMHVASPHIQASNDNQHHGTVAQAPERHVGHA